MTELAEGVKRTPLPAGTCISTGPDFDGMPLERLPQNAVFVHIDNGKRQAKDSKDMWFYGEIEFPPELRNSYPGKVWARLEVKKGRQGGHWRGSNV